MSLGSIQSPGDPFFEDRRETHPTQGQKPNLYTITLVVIKQKYCSLVWYILIFYILN